MRLGGHRDRKDGAMTEAKTRHADLTPEVKQSHQATRESAPREEENLTRYVHLVWRIYERRRAEAIDRKTRPS